MQQHIRNRVTSDDSRRYIRHCFTMPENAQSLHIDFRYTPKHAGNLTNLLTFSLFDPERERGTAHRGQSEQHFELTATTATPGFLPGPLQHGEWIIVINTNLINPGMEVVYSIDLSVSFDAQPAPPPQSEPGHTTSRGPGWYRGELHSHTLHSDGSWRAEDLVAFARQSGLDFITLTDHNTVSGLTLMDSLSRDDLLTMGGFEITSFYGHALALGVRELIDWRVRGSQRTIIDIQNDVESAGGTFIMAHPMAPGDPVCTGCHWDYPDLMPGSVRIVEVWNEHWDSISQNEDALRLFYGWLNTGHRLVATVGSDIHGPPPLELEFGFNVVYADDLSETAILHAINVGHLYLSSGPTLTLTAQAADGTAVMMGDTLHGPGCMLHYTWRSCNQGDTVRLIVDGEVQITDQANADGERRIEMTQGRWFTVEVRSEKGTLRGLTNPIFWHNGGGHSASPPILSSHINDEMFQNAGKKG